LVLVDIWDIFPCLVLEEEKMSVTRMLKDSSVRDFLWKHVTVPKVKEFPEIQVQLTSSDPARMGTAMDYAIRFYLASAYGGIHPGPLVAEYANDALGILSKEDIAVIGLYIDTAKKFFSSARVINVQYLEYCWALAGMDLVHRLGIRPVNLIDIPTSEEIDEMKRMMRGVIKFWPKPQEYCLLNPTFGEASYVTGGADADVVQDDTIIDIKTIKVKKNPYLADHILQLVMYAALSKIDGVDGRDNVEIKKLGIWFSRHFQYLEWPLGDIVSTEGLDEIVKFLEDRAGMFVGTKYKLGQHSIYKETKLL
jgi:hypothetical protein